MQFKEGNGWKACYDEERDLYTAERGSRGFYALYEIDKAVYDKLGTDGVDDLDAEMLIIKGRELFVTDDSGTTCPYYLERDEAYNELAPWSRAKRIADKTDAFNKRIKLTGRFPGVSLAFGTVKGDIRDMYFGGADNEDNLPLNEETVFPACSISKFITAICIMRMHEMKAIDIDDAVNKYLDGWKLLTADGKESDASIRSIMSHTAGIIDSEDSFHGLRLSDPEVSLLDILEGKTKYNDRPVRAEKPQGTSFEYSDAGYCVLQQMMQDVTGKPFEDIIKEMVFDGLGLEDSFYGTPENIRKHSGKMAAGYSADGSPLPGKYSVTPDLAASGLWSKPSELIVIAREFLMALEGKSALLQKETAREMIKPVKDFSWTGLGIFLKGNDVLSSGGWGENGQCMMKLYTGDGVVSVVMTNMDPGVDQAESGVEWLVDSYIYFI